MGLVNKFITSFFYYCPKSTKNDGRNGTKIAKNDRRVGSFLKTWAFSVSNKFFGKCGNKATSLNFFNDECNLFILFE